MRSSILFMACSLAIAPLSLGCGDDTTDGTGQGGKSSTSATSGSSHAASTGVNGTGSGGDGPTCDRPDAIDSETLNVDVTAITAHVVDTSGAPITQQQLEVCGKNICLYAMTNDSGDTTPPHFGSNTLDRPVFKAGNGTTQGKTAFPVLVGAEDIEAVVLPLADSGKDLAAGQTITVSGASMVIDATAGFSFAIDAPEDDHRLHGAEVATDKVDVIAPDQDFDALWAFGPIQTIICPAAKLTVPNTGGIAANATVGFYYQDLTTTEEYGTYGAYSKVATGKVSADGTTISTDDASGLPVLGYIGIKAE